MIESFKCRDTEALFKGRRLPMREISPVTPGELLYEEFMKPMGITTDRLALEINIPEERINGILEGREPMTVDIDLRLCRLLGLSDGYWMRAQVFYESEMAMESMRDALSAIRPWKENLPRQSQYSK